MEGLVIEIADAAVELQKLLKYQQVVLAIGGRTGNSMATYIMPIESLRNHLEKFSTIAVDFFATQTQHACLEDSNNHSQR